MTPTNTTGDGARQTTFSVTRAIAWFIAIVTAGGLLLVAAPMIQAVGMSLWASLFG